MQIVGKTSFCFAMINCVKRVYSDYAPRLQDVGYRRRSLRPVNFLDR